MEVNDLGTQAAQASQQTTQQGAQGTDGAAAQAGASATATDKTRPEWLPESYYDPEAGSIKLDEFGKHYGELATSAKAEADRLAAYPQKVEDLKFALPADVKLPDGVTFDEKNPQFVAFRQFAFDKKLPVEVANETLAMYVREKVGEVDAINKRVTEELGKLGSTGANRIEALRTFFTGLVGDAQGKAIMAGVFTAPQVEGMEKVMLALTNQGTQKLDGGNRDANTETISDEEYDALSPTKKLEYARSKQKPA